MDFKLEPMGAGERWVVLTGAGASADSGVQTFRGGGVNLFARRHGTGERNFGHARVCDQRCANVSIALHDVVDTGWCARLVQDFRDFKSAKCRGF